MLNQTIANLLSTLLGGLLTILGGFIATHYTHRTADKIEKRKEARDILDSIYRNTQVIELYYLSLFIRIGSSQEIVKVDRASKEYSNVISAISEMGMMTDVYVNTLGEYLQLYTSGMDELDDKIDAYEEEKDKEKAGRDIAKKIREIHVNFRNEIVKLLKKKGYTYF